MKQVKMYYDFESSVEYMKRLSICPWSNEQIKDF